MNKIQSKDTCAPSSSCLSIILIFNNETKLERKKLLQLSAELADALAAIAVATLLQARSVYGTGLPIVLPQAIMRFECKCFKAESKHRTTTFI